MTCKRAEEERSDGDSVYRCLEGVERQPMPPSQRNAAESSGDSQLGFVSLCLAAGTRAPLKYCVSNSER